MLRRYQKPGKFELFVICVAERVIMDDAIGDLVYLFNTKNKTIKRIIPAAMLKSAYWDTGSINKRVLKNDRIIGRLKSKFMNLSDGQSGFIVGMDLLSFIY